MLSIGPADYIEFTASNNPLVPFTSDPSTHRQCFNVTITDDEALEETERFSLLLDLSGEPSVPVVVAPNISVVDVLDDDGLHIQYLHLLATLPRVFFLCAYLQRFLLDLREFLHLFMKAMTLLSSVLSSLLRLTCFQLTSISAFLLIFSQCQEQLVDINFDSDND